MKRLKGTVLYPNAAVPSSNPASPKTTANSVSFSLGCHLESGWPPREAAEVQKINIFLKYIATYYYIWIMNGISA
jgi:hypothetical protein